MKDEPRTSKNPRPENVKGEFDPDETDDPEIDWERVARAMAWHAGWRASKEAEDPRAGEGRTGGVRDIRDVRDIEYRVCVGKSNKGEVAQ